MSRIVTKFIIHTVILIMTFEFVTAAFVQPESYYSPHPSIHTKGSLSSILSSILFEKTEEEERTEEETTKFLTVELADFTKIAIFLSKVHSPNIAFISHEQKFDHQPSLFTLFCVFII